MNRWTTGQVSKQFKISVRTLRYYDQIDLLAPSFKDENGRRYYSEADLFTLEKITLLKSLMLPLDEIRSLLDKLSYRDILQAHYNHLQQQLAELQAGISNTASLINMIDLEGSLSWERVSHLVKMSKRSPKKWLEYFGDDEQQFLQKNIPRLENNDRGTQHYISLLKRIEWCIQNDILPESDEGYRIACELITISNDTFGGDEELMNKFWEVRRKPSDITGLYPVSDEVLEFTERCIAFTERLQNEEAE